MEIHGPGGVTGPERPAAPHPEKTQGVDRPSSPERIVDQVQISEQAHYLEKLSQVPPIRYERVAELQRLIENGTYETSERIEGAVEKLLEEL
jgi:anti-sigma28 factor (negative regulator of flagellin synthesis)